MTTPVVVPRSLGDVTAHWLSEALGSRHHGLEVRSVEVVRITHGTATKVLLSLEYNDVGKAAGLPRRMCLKGGFEEHSPDMAVTGIYQREARFYRDLRSSLPVTAPHAYFAQFDDEVQSGVSLLEDLSARSVHFCQAYEPATVEQVASMLDNLARLHAHWWQSPILEASAFETFVSEHSGSAYWFKANDEAVLAKWMEDRRCDAVPDSVKDPERTYRALWAVVDKLNRGPFCLIHADAHHGNSYFEEDGTGGLYDWQTWAKGPWAHDVNYYLVSALDITDRRQAERELLEHYLDRLRAHGGTPPSPDTAWREFCCFSAYGYYAWMCNPESFQPEANNTALTTRFGHAVADHATFNLLGV